MDDEEEKDSIEISENLQSDTNGSEIGSLSSIWENMPTQAFLRIFRNLKIQTIKNIREVCSRWKHEMDVNVGLKVKIDGRHPENIDFIRKISITSARVLHLEDPVPEDLILSPRLIKRLILSGSISPTWFQLNIPKFTQLKKLVLRGGFLTSHDLSNRIDFSSPLPTYIEQEFLTPQQIENDAITAEITPPPVFNSRPIILKSLKSLEIMVNEFSYPFFLPLAVRLRDPARAALNEQDFNKMAMRVANNISTLLTTIKTPVLNMLQVYSYQKIGNFIPASHNWRFHPLESFLESHKDTLKELYLPEFEGKHQNGNYRREMPMKLSKIAIMLSCFIGDRDEGQSQDSTYWTEFLCAQTELKAIELQIVDMAQSWINETFSILFTKCRSTLTFIELLLQLGENFELTCNLFRHCTSLETLRISCRENEGFITHFTELPASLKKIRMNACYIIVPNQAEIKKFTNLVMLEMSIFMLDGGLHSRSLAAVQEILKLRKLNYVGISFNESAGGNPKFREILENFSLFYDPRFQYTGIKINYAFELTEGWSDEVFDEPDTDRDFTTHREPEDMESSFNSTPSAMDDDPRIIMFQNIPLLIRHITGEEIDGNDDESSQLDDMSPRLLSPDSSDDDWN